MKKLMLIPLLALSACSYDSGNRSIKAQNNAAIINGQNVTDVEDYALSTVALVAEREGQISTFCTGTLISNNLVVTAAHCTAVFERMQAKVLFGTTIPTDSKDARLVEIEESISNKDFGVDSKTGLTKGDVAVIKLVGGAPEGYKPVPVLESVSAIKAGDALSLIGWGRMSETEKVKTTNLQKTVVEVAQVRDEEIVTDQTKGTGACNGDSGGPAYIETSKGLVLAGATRGPETGYVDCHHYGNYTLLVNYKDFLKYAAQAMQGEYPQFVTP
ncbi:trypsin-like serine protease [Bdellovibrio sp. SKB1291214]|uniref:S1 family peptidase n=1 Tax=Bdellovibrio sp. SKB1291214 TaxID=1732569 RepID=UPI000B51BF37|nr:trypsin-like serine protease [Bdellovibrio sp. SKB1291214]UYL09590.1 trypsin-like serine protease [Bdellovibrio sp. SKB1291214]